MCGLSRVTHQYHRKIRPPVSPVLPNLPKHRNAPAGGISFCIQYSYNKVTLMYTDWRKWSDTPTQNLYDKVYTRGRWLLKLCCYTPLFITSLTPGTYYNTMWVSTIPHLRDSLQQTHSLVSITLQVTTHLYSFPGLFREFLLFYGGTLH